MCYTKYKNVLNLQQQTVSFVRNMFDMSPTKITAQKIFTQQSWRWLYNLKYTLDPCNQFLCCFTEIWITATSVAWMSFVRWSCWEAFRTFFKKLTVSCCRFMTLFYCISKLFCFECLFIFISPVNLILLKKCILFHRTLCPEKWN
jgi:hypothetical protein